jgi:hypothetical protein
VAQHDPVVAGAPQDNDGIGGSASQASCVGQDDPVVVGAPSVCNEVALVPNLQALLSQMVAEMAESDPQATMIGQYMVQSPQDQDEPDAEVQEAEGDESTLSLTLNGQDAGL